MADTPLDHDAKAVEDLATQMHRAGGDVGHRGVYVALAQAALLHASKNKGYRSASNPFANFEESPLVAKKLLTPLQYAYTLMTKQDDALPRLVWARRALDFNFRSSLEDEYRARGGDPMLRERLLDGIVYRAIMLAMLDVCDAPTR